MKDSIFGKMREKDRLILSEHINGYVRNPRESKEYKVIVSF